MLCKSISKKQTAIQGKGGTKKISTSGRSLHTETFYTEERIICKYFHMIFSHSLFLWKWQIRCISFSFMIYLPISFESSSELEEKWVNNFKGYSWKAIQSSLKWLIILYFEVNFYSSYCTKGCLSYWRFSSKLQWDSRHKANGVRTYKKKVLCPVKQGYCGFQEMRFSISQEFFLFCSIIIL